MVSPYLTDVQQKEWQKEGFLIIKNVLSPAEIETLLTGVDSVIETYVQETPSLQGSRFGKGAYTIIRAIEYTDALDPLTDHPHIFGTILSLIGPYLQIMGTQIYVRHPDVDALIGFHTDAGPSLQRIHPHPDSLPLQFKIQFFLTDLTEPDQGNFMCVPGSHKVPFPENGFKKREVSRRCDSGPCRSRRRSYLSMGIVARCRSESDGTHPQKRDLPLWADVVPPL
jgi:hypothetical protein